MKKRILLFAIAAAVIALPVYAQTRTDSTGTKTHTKKMKTKSSKTTVDSTKDSVSSGQLDKGPKS